jgi:hypothetical protein
MPPNTRTRYLPNSVTIEHPVIMNDHTLANILTDYAQQLLASGPVTPPKPEPHQSKLPPPRGRRR